VTKFSKPQKFLNPSYFLNDLNFHSLLISPAGVVIKAFSMWLSPNEDERRCALPVWCEEPRFDETPEDDVRAGMQSTLQAFIIHSSYVFLLNPNHEMIEMHACTCKDVLNQYRKSWKSPVWESGLNMRHLLSVFCKRLFFGSDWGKFNWDFDIPKTGNFLAEVSVKPG